MVQVMDAKGTQAEAVKLMREARSHILLLGFTYDLPEFQKALLDAFTRRITVQIGLDRRTTMSNRPRDQQQFAQQLEAQRVPVRLLKGGPLGPEYAKVGRQVSGTGIQHAKTILIDNKMIVGSCNWTVSSKANGELSVLIRLNEGGLRLMKSTIETKISAGEPLEAALAAPRRSRSSSRNSRVDETDSAF